MISRPLFYLSCVLLSFTLISCGSSRKTQRYDYLTKDLENYESDRPEQPTTDVAEAPKTPVSETGAAGTLTRKEQEKLIETALSYQGTPYKYGGTTDKGMDCSGLVYTSFQSVNKSVPRTSSGIASEGTPIKTRDILPGHLVLFSAKGGSRIDHVGLVVSGTGSAAKFIHATTSQGVRVDALDSNYWKPRFRKAVSF